MNENFIVIDATDDIVIGGFGNLEGNLGLLKYSYEEISQKMKENNNKEDDIRLVNSLLDSIRELQQENQKYKEVIDKAVDIAWKYGQIDGDHHQKWVTDQMVRALLGSDYENFVKDYEEDGDYEWDIGIAP